MSRITTCASIVALALLGGCIHERESNAPTIATQQMPYQPGSGTVTAVTSTPRPVRSGAGATAAPSAPSYRLTIRMDNGTVQYLDTDSADFRPGSRIELLPDRSIRMP